MKALLAALLLTAPLAAEPYVMQGQVRDSHGKPVANAEVVADNRQFYNTNAVTRTDAQGRYRVEVRRPVGTWHATAQVQRKFNGQNFTFDLHPDNDNDFDGKQGATRNFTWKLRGERRDGGRYGSPVIVYKSLNNPYDIDITNVELTLKPVGPLPDGSAGQTIVGKVQPSGDGDAVPDVPVARYEISARYLDPAQGPLPLTIRKRHSEAWTPSVVADFKITMPTVQNIEVEVQSP
jgi:hypothetical protein